MLHLRSAIVLLVSCVLAAAAALSPAPADHLVPPPPPPPSPALTSASLPLPLPQRLPHAAAQSFAAGTAHDPLARQPQQLPLRLAPPPLALPLQQTLQHHQQPIGMQAASGGGGGGGGGSVDIEQQQLQHQQQQPQLQLQQDAPGPGFMTRIARWFGFGGAPHEQQLAASSHSYAYPQPHQAAGVGYDGKAPCNLCNKYPWVPMLPLQAVPWQSLEAQASQQVPHQQLAVPHFASKLPAQLQQGQQGQQALPVKQRAVQFKFPIVAPTALPPAPVRAYAVPAQQFGQLAHGNLQIVPLAVPNLSNLALPPLFNAQPFRPLSTAAPFTAQQLPTTEPAHFVENIGAHSELQPDHVPPAYQALPQHTNANAASIGNSFEIVKSHQLTDFVTSVEYPATYVPSHAIDLMPTNHKPSAASPPLAEQPPGTAKYELSGLDVQLHGHVPASHLLTDSLTHFANAVAANGVPPGVGDAGAGAGIGAGEAANVAEATQIFEQTTTNSFLTNIELDTQTPPPPPFEYYYGEADNYPSASSQQQQHQQQQQQQQEQQQQEHLQELAHFQPHWQTHVNEFYQPTPTPTAATTTTTTTTTTNRIPTEATAAPQDDAVGTYTTEDQHNAIASDIEVLQVPASANSQLRPLLGRHRETPKRLLDAPIKYGLAHQAAGGTPPRPFTRDPADLSFRLNGHAPSSPHANHVYNARPLPTPAPPTPTSTYGALDASGQYAHMSPPPAQPDQLQQVVIPYTTKNKPRPFEPHAYNHNTNNNNNNNNAKHNHEQHVDNHNWAQSQLANDIEVHEQQESKLVSTATVPPPTATPAPAPTSGGGRRNTKYLTKILASNLRELLKRERETKQTKLSAAVAGFDLHKLQRNIDDWTEQEYTSLSHRPSTPTIRGRSKHIPSEYLTTMTPPTPRQPKTTGGFDNTDASSVSELSTSINNLEQLLVRERGQGKRFGYVPAIDDNAVLDYYESLQSRFTKTTTTTTTPPPPTMPLKAMERITTSSSSSGSTSTVPTTTNANDTDALILPFYVRSSGSGSSSSSPAAVVATELWKKARVAISPQTNEKVYVVTPQPRHLPLRSTSEPAATSLRDSVTSASSKSPRFLVRPTPANSTKNDWQPISRPAAAANVATPAAAHYTPDIFGLMGLSAYVPADPVEIIDGNSKVITIVTPASLAQQQQQAIAAAEQHKHKHSSYNNNNNSNKPTMSPSPR